MCNRHLIFVATKASALGDHTYFVVCIPAGTHLVGGSGLRFKGLGVPQLAG